MTITKIAVFALVCLILLMLLKKHVSQFSALAEVAVVVFLIILILPDFTGLLEATKEISSVTAVSSDVLKTMLKAFIILNVGGIVSDICRDNSENTLAGVVDTVVKILAISCAIPTFSAVLITALALLEQ